MIRFDSPPLFSLGRLVSTPAALEVIGKEGKSPFEFAIRHAMGDYGDICEEDRALNDEAVADGSRILSAYQLEKSDERLWCITEAVNENGQREVTTLLLSHEY
jgi:hypothetical protein